MNYLYKCYRPYIAYSKRKYSYFSVKPKRQHAKYLHHLGRYLKVTMEKGTIYSPNMDKGLGVHVDDYFAGNWDKEY